MISTRPLRTLLLPLLIALWGIPSFSSASDLSDLTVGCEVPSCYLLSTESSPYKVLLKPVLKTIPVNDYFDIDVSVLNRMGQPVSFPIELALDATMPAHHHGMNVVPLVHKTEQGQFRVEGLLFHMPGSWEIAVTVLRGLMREKLTQAVEIL